MALTPDTKKPIAAARRTLPSSSLRESAVIGTRYTKQKRDHEREARERGDMVKKDDDSGGAQRKLLMKPRTTCMRELERLAGPSQFNASVQRS